MFSSLSFLPYQQFMYCSKMLFDSTFQQQQQQQLMDIVGPNPAAIVVGTPAGTPTTTSFAAHFPLALAQQRNLVTAAKTAEQRKLLLAIHELEEFSKEGGEAEGEAEDEEEKHFGTRRDGASGRSRSRSSLGCAIPASTPPTSSPRFVPAEEVEAEERESSLRRAPTAANVVVVIGAGLEQDQPQPLGQQQQCQPSFSAIDDDDDEARRAAAGAAAEEAEERCARRHEERRHHHQHHQRLAQLSPAASITAEVQRVSIEDRPIPGIDASDICQQQQQRMALGEASESQPKKSSPEPGRLERAGRALRKHAAVEDEEQLLEGPPGAHQQQQHQQHHPLVVPALHVGQISPLGLRAPSHCSSSLPSVSPLISPELASFAASVARPSVPSTSQQHLEPAIQLALLQQCHRQQQTAQIKHEPMSREDLLNTLVHHQQQQANREQLLAAATCPSWLSNAAVAAAAAAAASQQQQMGGMGSALLTALMQHQQQNPVDGRAEPLLVDTQTSRLAAIQEERQQQPPNADNISRLFETGRNQSTESTASTSGGSLPSGSAAGVAGTVAGESIPRKQDIQTDIRMNRGRFQLVRKRGRSEVWNLFGQVVDTLTGARLPYVACYACKVLYTDTGGGTGNMTRHRCSMGSSYRSSSDTTVGGNESLSINQSSSFDSIAGGAPLGGMGQSGGSSFGATSPPYEGQQQQHQQLLMNQLSSGSGPKQQSSLEQKVWSVTAGAREAFAQSGSSGFLSAGSTTSAGSMPIGASASSTSMESTQHPQCQPPAPPHYQQLSLSLGPPSLASAPMLSRFFGGSGSTGSSTAALSPLSLHPPHVQHSMGLLSALSPVPAISASAPSSITRATAHGHHFTAADKQLFAQAVMQFCAQDMHNWDVVEGEGFKNLVETILFIGRRSHGDPTSNAYDPVRQLIPTARQLKQVFTTQERAVLHATARDLDQVKMVGLALNCQTLEFGGERHFAILANYITDDWRITRRTLRVEKAFDAAGQLRQLGTIVADVLAQFHLDGTRLVLLTMDPSVEEQTGSDQLGQLPSNVQLLANANRALNNILAQSLAECPDSGQILAFIGLCTRAISFLSALDHLGRFPQLERSLTSLRRERGSVKGHGEVPSFSSLDITNEVYPALKFVKENCAEILTILDREALIECDKLASELRQINWQVATELELFLEPFHETAQIFTDSKQPHFQRILPEWYALMHECQCQSGQPSMDDTSTTPSGASVSTTLSSSTFVDVEGQEGGEGGQDMATSNPSAMDTMASGGTPAWIRGIRLKANQRLREWAEANIRLEHRAATVLNPRLRHLPLICSEPERASVYERIRELVGLSRPKREAGEVGIGKSEPFKKRRRFLDQLEDCAMEEEDELDCYLRTTFAPSQTRDMLEFWSSIGEAQFPRLARLARFLLATSGAPSPVPMQQPSTGVLGPSAIATLLNLRPEVLNSVNQQLAHHRTPAQQQQRHQQHQQQQQKEDQQQQDQ